MQGKTLEEGFIPIREATGLTVNHSVFRKWRKSIRSIPAEAIRCMAVLSVPYIAPPGFIEQFGEDAAIYFALSVCPPTEKATNMSQKDI
jgi:hypothetical protein